MKYRLALLALLVLASQVWAQTPWEAFHQALDAYEFEKASELARKLPERGARELALAEVALVSDRPDLSYLQTDKLQGLALSPELQAKSYLVAARQERLASFESQDERDKVVRRMIREGLRTAVGRDRASLLLLKVEYSAADEMALAQDACREIAEVEDADPAFLQQAQARLAARAGRRTEAAAIWRALAQTAGLREQQRAQSLYSQRAIRQAYAAEPRPALLQSLRSLLEQAVASQDGYAALQAWSLLQGLSPSEQQTELLDYGETVVASLEDPMVKLEILHEVMGPLFTLDRPRGLVLGQQGLRIASELDSPVLQAFFLLRTADFGDREFHDASRARALSLLEGVDPNRLRGTFFGNVIATAVAQREPLDRQTIDSAKLTRDLQALKPGATPRDHFAIFEPYIFEGTNRPDPALLEAAFFPALEVALSMPESDRDWALRRLSYYFMRQLNCDSMAVPPERRELLQEAAVRGLGARLAARPELLDPVLDSVLAHTRRQSDGFADFYLAEWLIFLGRQAEARELLDLVKGSGIDEGWSSNAAKELAAMLVAAGDETGLELARRALPQVPDRDSDWEQSSQLGWLALSLRKFTEAENLGRRALELGARSPEMEAWRVARVGPVQLVALALAGQGKTDQALAVLEQSATTHDLVRADVLSQGQRYEQAAAAISTLSAEHPAGGVYEWRVRRRIAQGAGDQAALKALEAAQALYLGRASMLPDDPVYAALFRQAAAPVPAPFQIPQPNTTPPTFADLVERLEALRRREPENGSLKRISAADLREIMARAGPDEIYVQPILLEHSVVTVFLTDKQAGLVETFCDRTRLERAMTGLTDSLSTPDSDLEASDAERRYLAERLVKPWRSRFPDKRRLRWVGDGPLGKLPLPALPQGEDWLLQAIEVTYLDGLSALPAFALEADAPALLVGGASDLEGATLELQAVRRLYPRGGDWRLGNPTQALVSQVPRHRLLHISTHGTGPDARSLGGKLRGDGHELSAFDLSELSFPEHSLAVLGTCDSFLDAGTGHDNSSLVSALRTAGAEVVVGSLWPLDDKVSVELFGVFYESLKRGASPEEALATAQRAVARKWKHPFYWAGLQVVAGP